MTSEKNLRHRSAHHQRTSLPDTPSRRHDSEPELHMLTIPLVNIIITPPIDPTPNLFSNSNIYTTVNAHSNSCANQKGGLLTKQNLGGEWSRPFCSRPRVGSSKGPKPVVMRGPERVLPLRPVFFEHIS